MRTFTRFGLVGASGVAVNACVFWLVSSSLHVPVLPAGVLAFETALVSNFTLNHRWTFATRRSPWLLALVRYQAATLGGFVLQLAVLHLLTVVGLPAAVANVFGIAAASAWNVAVSMRWTWRPSPASSTAPVAYEPTRLVVLPGTATAHPARGARALTAA